LRFQTPPERLALVLSTPEAKPVPESPQAGDLGLGCAYRGLARANGGPSDHIYTHSRRCIKGVDVSVTTSVSHTQHFTYKGGPASYPHGARSTLKILPNFYRHIGYVTPYHTGGVKFFGSQSVCSKKIWEPKSRQAYCLRKSYMGTERIEK
jgi:hypothetical protein